MRYQLKIAAATFAACWSLSSSTAFAQQGRVDPIVTAIDANGDGSVSSLKLKSAAASIRKLDTDGDGVVSLNEASGKSNPSDGRSGGSKLGGYTQPPPANNVPDHPAKEKNGAVAALMKLDADRDGVLDAQELAVSGGGGQNGQRGGQGGGQGGRNNGSRNQSAKNGN